MKKIITLDEGFLNAPYSQQKLLDDVRKSESGTLFDIQYEYVIITNISQCNVVDIINSLIIAYGKGIDMGRFKQKEEAGK